MPKLKLEIEINADSRLELVDTLGEIRKEIASAMPEVVGMTAWGPNRKLIDRWRIEEQEKTK